MGGQRQHEVALVGKEVLIEPVDQKDDGHEDEGDKGNAVEQRDEAGKALQDFGGAERGACADVLPRGEPCFKLCNGKKL